MAARAPTLGSPASWRESLNVWRNQIIASPGFQRWAARSPLTRYIARRRARALFDLCAGFVYSQALLACVRLRVCEHLAEGPRSVDALSRLIDLKPEATLRLLRAAASLRLVRDWPDGRFALDDLGAALIGNPSIAAFIEHHELLYDDLRDPVALLRGETTTRLSQFWPYAHDRPGAPPRDGSAGDHAAYSALMARTQALVARDILDAYPLAGHQCLLDVGGGEGGFIAQAAERAPGMGLQLFDLPPVVDRARARLAAQGLAERISFHAGSFLSDPLPCGADIISLVRIVHDHDDESVLALLRAAHAALPAGGTLLIAEPMAGAPGAEPIGDAYFGFYLLAMGRGRARRPEELRELLRVTGFSGARVIPTRRPLQVGIVAAQKL